MVRSIGACMSANQFFSVPIQYAEPHQNRAIYNFFTLICKFNQLWFHSKLYKHLLEIQRRSLLGFSYENVAS